jgi:hypothetical protein
VQLSGRVCGVGPHDHEVAEISSLTSRMSLDAPDDIAKASSQGSA